MAEETQALSVQAPQINQGMSFDTTESRAELMRFAEALAMRADITPKRFRGREKVGNCMLALDMAGRMGVNPLMVMKNLYDVNGEPAWKAEFLIARVNQCGRFTPLDFEWRGTEGSMQWGCRAYSTERATGSIRYGSWITLQMAKDEGWSTKSGSKWKTMPQQMMMYRAGAFWQRTHGPELSLGLPTYEELEDITPGAGNAPRRPLGEVMRGKPIEQAAIESGDLTVEELQALAVDNIRERAVTLGVSNANLEAAVGRSIPDWTEQDLTDLNEMLIKIESGLQTADQVFG